MLLALRLLQDDAVAFGTVALSELVPDVNRMGEFRNHRAGGNIFLFLADDRMAEIAILGDHLPVRRFVLAVMAAEAAGEIEVADVVRVGVPCDLHLGKEVPGVDLLHLLDRLLDGSGLLGGQLRVVGGVRGGEGRSCLLIY